MAGVYTVLFLCTGNSARSILAEALLNHWGRGRFQAFSAGSHPKGQVHPLALAELHGAGLPSADLRSKSWDEFARPGAPILRLVITVCDRAAAEACPIWPGAPLAAHWGLADPAAPELSETERPEAFRSAYRVLEQRIRRLVSLPLDALLADAAGPARLKRELDRIGQPEADPS
jgi:arsenate reductase